ncbi:cytidylate kinase [Nocardioides baekrokdamisoli]|uniref:Cytidylate kinase n=1 Tax=Nocardioides baekrokdamisoli TaxID=1804624 RepID=A0A3G9ICF0_9ACTN|nr:cytidylate kinase [Nocardioides baekrokdamisoli]
MIAVDGTSGSGKSSTSRRVADALGLAYLDTGSMYRAETWWMLSHGVDTSSEAAVAEKASLSRIEVGTDPLTPWILLDGDDVSEPIRTDEVNAHVSLVARVPAVRTRMVQMQREAIIGAPRGIVVEGRDIGSVVWPAADLKLYLTADPAARAARRTLEEGSADVAATEASLAARDAIDSTRATAPLVQADGAVTIDSTFLTLDAVVAQVLDLVAGLRR